MCSLCLESPCTANIYFNSTMTFLIEMLARHTNGTGEGKSMSTAILVARLSCR